MLQRTPGTLLDFAAWLETKDPTEKYVWNDWQNCACGQYFKERHIFHKWMHESQNYGHWNSLARQVTKPHRIFWARLFRHSQDRDVGTFGDLLNVVRKELNA